MNKITEKEKFFFHLRTSVSITTDQFNANLIKYIDFNELELGNETRFGEILNTRFSFYKQEIEQEL
ncbi:MAG TPA: hypothetical protein VD794_13375, partial [Flavisolibacter sp.]|nr:hypothetical protein [Flavisolibacter sp.]